MYHFSDVRKKRQHTIYRMLCFFWNNQVISRICKAKRRPEKKDSISHCVCDSFIKCSRRRNKIVHRTRTVQLNEIQRARKQKYYYDVDDCVYPAALLCRTRCTAAAAAAAGQIYLFIYLLCLFIYLYLVIIRRLFFPSVIEDICLN